MTIEAKSVFTIVKNETIFTLILLDFEFNFNFNFNLRISNFTLTPSLKLKLKFYPKSDFLNDVNIPRLGVGSNLVAFVAY